MTPDRRKRHAEVALVALYRASVVEGIESLGREGLATRIGRKTYDTNMDSVFVYMAEQGWIVRRDEDVIELQKNGKINAQSLLNNSVHSS